MAASVDRRVHGVTGRVPLNGIPSMTIARHHVGAEAADRRE
jgi:hypothetical protein